MNKYLFTALGTAVTALGAIAVFLFTILIAPLAGAFSGAVFSYFFDDTASAFVSYIGMPVQFWQLGALAGYFTGFLRAKSAT